MKITEAAETGTAAADYLISACGYLQTLSRDTADGDLSKVLDSVAGFPVDCLRSHSSILLHLSPDGGPCVPLASRNASWGLPADCSAQHGCCVRDAVDSQSPILTNHLCSPISPCADLLQTTGPQTLACIPIISDSYCPAVLVCSRAEDNPFHVWELELLNTAANHAAAALKTHNRETEHQKRVDSLERIRNIVNGTVDESLELAFHELVRFMGADGGSVLVRDEASLRLGASTGLNKGVPQRVQAQKGSVSGRVLSSRKPLLIHGPANPAEYPDASPRPELASAMVLPLINNKSILGLLSLNRTSSTRRPFTDEDLALAETAAQHLAMALHNVHLHQAVRAQTKTFGSLYRVAKSVTSRLDPDIIVKLIIKSLKTLVSCDMCAVFLNDSHSHRYNMAGGFGFSSDEDTYVSLLPSNIESVLDTSRSLLISESRARSDIPMPEAALEAGMRSALFEPLRLKQKNSGMIALFRTRPGGFTRQEISLVQGLSELASIAFENARLYERQKAIANITQRELTPRVASNIPGFQIGTRFTPAHNVGGDYFDIIRVDSTRYGLAILDVAGKDIAASLSVAMCKYALRALAEYVPSPARLLSKMNRFICEYIAADSFISMFYVLIDTARDEIVYASAGHEPAILLKSETCVPRYLHSSGMLLGVHPQAQYRERRSLLTSNDVLLLYTDGLINSFPRETENPMEELGGILANNAMHHAQKITDNIHDSLVTGESQHAPDDVALVAVRRTRRNLVHGK